MELFTTGDTVLTNELKRVDFALAKAPKEVKKEGLSEYFLYTIEGNGNDSDGLEQTAAVVRCGRDSGGESV